MKRVLEVAAGIVFIMGVGAALLMIFRVLPSPQSNSAPRVAVQNSNHRQVGTGAGSPTATPSLEATTPTVVGGETTAFQGHPLVGETTEQINQYALDYTTQSYSVTGTPKILLSRSVTWQEAMLMQLPPGNPESAPDHYYVVILQGDFTGPLGGVHPPHQFSYIAYVFDLEHGIPTTAISSPDGSAVKKALADPSLPDPVHPLFNGLAPPNPFRKPTPTP